MILIDTDICIEILRGNKKVINKRLQNDDEIAVSFMTVGELLYGAYNSSQVDHNISLVEEFLLSVKIINTDFKIMKKFGTIKAELKKQNILLPDADILIASTAINNCEILITGNIKHFNRIEGIKIDNWI